MYPAPPVTRIRRAPLAPALEGRCLGRSPRSTVIEYLPPRGFSRSLRSRTCLTRRFPASGVQRREVGRRDRRWWKKSRTVAVEPHILIADFQRVFHGSLELFGSEVIGPTLVVQ